MRVIGSRKKKLIVALHFLTSNQAGWECASCRKAGLEEKRRCGWVPAALETSPRVVWARDDVATMECPKSFVTAQSIAWVEEYAVRRRFGQRDIDRVGARDVQAFLILEHELAKQEANARAGTERQTPLRAPRGKNA